MLLAHSFYHDTRQRHVWEPQKYQVSGGPCAEADDEGRLRGERAPVTPQKERNYESLALQYFPL